MKPFVDQMADFDKRREAARITSSELARVAGIQKATLSRYRKGGAEPGISQWIRLNGVLDALIVERAEAIRSAR